jgi:hypothetical protein
MSLVSVLGCGTSFFPIEEQLYCLQRLAFYRSGVLLAIPAPVFPHHLHTLQSVRTSGNTRNQYSHSLPLSYLLKFCKVRWMAYSGGAVCVQVGRLVWKGMVSHGTHVDNRERGCAAGGGTILFAIGTTAKA